MQGKRVTAHTLPTGPKKMLLWLNGNHNWHTRAQQSATHHQPVLYVNAGKPTKTNPLGTLKGSIKTPAHDRTHYGIQAVLVKNRTKIASLWATWEEVDNKITFTGCAHWDLATNLRYVDYQVTALNSWLRILAPIGAPTVRKTVTKPTNDDLILGGAEWQA